MSDYPQTPEGVAYALLREIALAEGVAFGLARQGPGPGDRRWILETYAECLKATKVEIVKAGPTHGRNSF